MAVETGDGQRGLGTLLRELAEGSATLVRQEARLARIEIADAASAIGRGAFSMAFGGVLALLGALSLLTGVVLLVGDQWLPRDLYWLAALIVLLVAGVLAFAIGGKGRSLLRTEALVPDATMETLKEDREWAKRLRTSGTTSS